MFKTLRATETKTLNHSGRSHVGETLQLEGDLRSSGSVDVAGLVNGNVFVSEIIITETGSVRGGLEASTVEINGHVEGKVTADSVIIGKTAVIKGDVFFRKTLKTEAPYRQIIMINIWKRVIIGFNLERKSILEYPFQISNSSLLKGLIATFSII